MTGSQIKEIRERLGLTQYAVAQAIELPRFCVSLAEGNLVRLMPEDEARLHQFFEAELAQVKNMQLPEASQ